MRTLIDFDAAPSFAIPGIDARGDRTVYEGVLIEGPQGWGEFSPPLGCDAALAVRWLTTAAEPGTVGWPDPLRGRVAVAVPVPAVDPYRAAAMATRSGCQAADVTVGAGGTPADDAARLAAVRDALGADAAVRCVVHGRPDANTIEALTNAAGGVEYVELPGATIEELRSLRGVVAVPVAAHASLADRPGVTPSMLAEVADVVVLRCGPLGGVRRALRVAEAIGLPCTVGSAGETSIGLAAGLALAGALPHLRYACGLGTGLLRDGDVVTGRSLTPVDGHLPVAPTPAAPDPDLLARFAVTDPGRAARWRDLVRTATAS